MARFPAWLAMIIIAALFAVVTIAPAQTLPLTLANLKGPLSQATGLAPAKTIATLWEQVRLLAKQGPSKPTTVPSPVPTATPTPAPTSTPKPAATPDLAKLLSPLGGPIPPTNAPDVIGAFRFICTPSHYSYDDPIVYPRQPGKAHLHEFFGNSKTDAFWTVDEWDDGSESTCNNILNRSAYWAPALLNQFGLIIRANYMSVYYKHFPDGDPMCFLIAPKGCVDWPEKLILVSGYDHQRMGQPQPENETWSHRCADPGKPSIHRAKFNDALKIDCGGEGEIISTVGVGNCWNGQLDSPDHRSHVVNPRYIGQAYPQCDAAHPFLMPGLTQSVSHTVLKSDGEVHYSSDEHAGGGNMEAGTTFHVDYGNKWRRSVFLIAQRNCMGKLLNCSGGELGNGQALTGGTQVFKANPRTMPAPPRPAG